jgi:hypothetical protein
MKTTETHTKESAKVPATDALSLAMSKLKGQVLFPEKIEAAKEYLKSVRFVYS